MMGKKRRCHGKLATILWVRPLSWRAVLCCVLLMWHAGVGAAAAGAAVADASVALAWFAEPRFERVGDAESIPDGMVSALAQDAAGFLWIGTQQGLLRYDGYRLRRFVHDARDPAALGHDVITCLRAARDGSLWIGTANGLSHFDPVSERFVNFRHQAGAAGSLAPGAVWALAEARDGALWVGGEHGLAYLPAAGRSFVHYRPTPQIADSLADERVFSLWLDQQSGLWIGTGNGLQRLRPGRAARFEAVASDPLDHNSLAGQEIRALFQSDDGKLWLGTRRHGAAWLDPLGLSLHWTGRATSWVKAIAQAAPDQIWLGSVGGGIEIVDANHGRSLGLATHDASLSGSLARDQVMALLRDQSGLLWVGVWGGGVQRHDPASRAFAVLNHSPLRPRGLSHPDVRSVLELDDGRWLLGLYDHGIDIVQPGSGLVGGFRPAATGDSGAPLDRLGPAQQTELAATLPDARIFAMAQTPDGTLWLGSNTSGVLRRSKGSANWQSIGTGQGLPGLFVMRFLVGRDGVLWAATARGLARWDALAQRFVPVANPERGSTLTTFNSLVQDASGRLWLGSSVGLWSLAPGQTSLQRVAHDAARADSLASDQINGVLVDGKDRVWVATDRGLDRLQDITGSVARFTHAATRPARIGLNFGENLLQDRQGRIWGAGFVFDPAQNLLHPVGRADGLDIGTGWAGSYGQTRSGLLLYGGTQGLAMVHSEAFVPWQYQPPVVATGLVIDGQPLSTGSIGQGIKIAPEQRNFSVEFAALDYSGPASIRYRYRLQGYDRDWIELAPGQRQASYGNLWPGDYTLEVAGSNRLGQWSGHQLHIPLRVLPRFWQTGWFLTLALLGTLASLYGAHRWRLRRIRIKSRLLRQMVDSRTADIMQLGEIGRQLTATLDLEQAFLHVYQHVSGRLDVYAFGIGLYDAAQAIIRFDFLMEDRQRLPAISIDMDEASRPAVWCVREQSELVVGTLDDLKRRMGAAVAPKTGQPAQSLVYLPLIAKERVIGCLTVQSQARHAYSAGQIEFLRVLASYSAIALSNSAAHRELASAHQHLRETQQQLIQQEKMASIGQLVANVAHEINTPIAAIKSSGRNISDGLDAALPALPELLRLLSPDECACFAQLVGKIHGPRRLLSSREERSLIRDLTGQLAALGVERAAQRAAVLVQLQAEPDWQAMLPLLRHREAGLIMTVAGHFGSALNNAWNINGAVERIGKIVFALRTLARIDPDGSMVEVRLQDEIDSVLTIYQNAIRQGVELVRDYQDIPPLLCYPDQLGQVFLNLIHNALQAMQNRGSLGIAISRVGDEVRVAVSDTGCGIPEALRERIFDAFFTTKAPGEGSGLGLGIARKIVDKHHGRIELISEPGVGSTFLVYLPLPGLAATE
jgi:signal transduction histidine kinase/ligand-binding sensor domain-containing protein